MEIELPESIRKMLKESYAIVDNNGTRIMKILDSIELLSMGAESYIFKARFMGIDSVIKWRFPKPYMPKELDIQMRRYRTELETKILWKVLSIGIKAPTPLFVDLKDCFLIMTFIDGENFRDIVEKINNEDLCRISKTIGFYAGLLHKNDIVHGDLTTSNVIISKDSAVHIIDFGLAVITKRIEDKAIDVHIFFRSIESAHKKFENIMKNCFINGYKDAVNENFANKIINTVKNIRLRGRYIAERKLRSEWVT
ncbi:Kae1-associated kinase Bud32 [Ignisphaera sp. 4213-co]|uniref:non-specific serine/threonine protein kinase n=1 Tax=Ignisphaera cupida TaxID=3050454 RepID=A0ABD4Z545_9CREN|nr:Kae1-associated kinase Bud32 [Ignisphaera sp. 4213-co]MDK6028334.1 Kae1-associated kinase Bud32 [Ignisphaera sp. 4213-co]